MSNKQLELKYAIDVAKRETAIVKVLNKQDTVNLPIDIAVELIQQAEKQVLKEITETINGGGICPSCSVRLIGKANYCGKCGQQIGWRVYDNE